jgi:putative ABC transport system substrate-binding protein
LVLLGAVLSLPNAGHAQKASNMPRVGVLWHAGNAEEEKIPLGGFIEGLRDAGYIDGKNIILEHRFPNEQPERFVSLAAELAQMDIDVLVAVTRLAAVAAQNATKTIPIIFVAVPDPVGSELVDNLARPRANITGLSNMALELVPKRMQVLKETIPNLERLGLLVNASVPAVAQSYVEIAQAAAPSLGIKLQPIEIRKAADVEPAFSIIAESGLQGLCLTSDGLIYVEQKRLARLAVDRSLPLIGYTREMADAGMLMTYGPSNVLFFKQAANMVIKVLKGTKPSDIPVEQPTKIELAINLKTAKTLGLTVPQALFARADDVMNEAR